MFSFKPVLYNSQKKKKKNLQVVNYGVANEVLENVKYSASELFGLPLEDKQICNARIIYFAVVIHY